MRQTNYIPQGGMNPVQLLLEFKKFKEDFYAQNDNPDPKAALDQYIQTHNVDQNTLNAGKRLASSLGIK